MAACRDESMGAAKERCCQDLPRTAMAGNGTDTWGGDCYAKEWLRDESLGVEKQWN